MPDLATLDSVIDDLTALRNLHQAGEMPVRVVTRTGAVKEVENIKVDPRVGAVTITLAK